MRLNKAEMGLSENQQAALAVFAVFLIGAVGLGLTGGVPGTFGNSVGSMIGAMLSNGIYVDEYSADVYLNGTIIESFVYQVDSSKYRMLYRNWKLPLSIGELNRPYVELINISQPSGTIAYLKNSSGSVSIISGGTGSTDNKNAIRSLALPSEAGCFKPDYLSPGRYQISYIFRIHPPIERDDVYWHWNLMIADKHLLYRQATITIHDPDNLILRLFPHMSMAAEKAGDSWVMTGYSPEDSLIEVEMLLKPEVSNLIGGFPRYISDIYNKTLSAQGSMLDLIILKALRALVILFPLALAFYFYIFGREKRFTVPSVLSYLPSKRKPWLVNYVFKGDSFDFDRDGFYATLLDLYERKIIDIDSATGTRLRILKADEAGDDEYEKAVLSFLEKYSYNGVFDAGVFEGMVESWSRSRERDNSKLKEIRNTLNNLFRYKDPEIPGMFVSGRSLRALGISRPGSAKSMFTTFYYIAIILFVFGSLIVGLLSKPIPATIAILLVQSLVPAFAPSALFGRWKGDYYKEKLEWDAFRNFLSDFAMIKKYVPEDINIWKDWLIYGTALGVGDNVEKAMDEMNINIPIAVAAGSVGVMHTHFDHAYASSAPRSSGSDGGGSGGGFGGGGGSGGGGGGAR